MATQDEAREFWQALREHEREDAGRHGEVMGELGGVASKLDALAIQVGRIDGRQWDETSKVKDPPASPPSTRVVVALIAAVVAVAQIADHALTALIASEKPAAAHVAGPAAAHVAGP